jgi:hypothetical protein
MDFACLVAKQMLSQLSYTPRGFASFSARTPGGSRSGGAAISQRGEQQSGGTLFGQEAPQSADDRRRGEHVCCGIGRSDVSCSGARTNNTGGGSWRSGSEVTAAAPLEGEPTINSPVTRRFRVVTLGFRRLTAPSKEHHCYSPTRSRRW